MVGNILIIGDQNKEGVSLKDALKKETSFTARTVSLGSASPKQVIEKEPDLIILNPKASYLEIMDTYYSFKKEPEIQDIPIVLLMDENEMKTADLPSGIQEILYRPLRSLEAIVRIKNLYKRVHKIDQKNVIKKG